MKKLVARLNPTVSPDWITTLSGSDQHKFDKLVQARLESPSTVGPPLDLRDGERPEDVFLLEADKDPSLRKRLEDSVSNLVASHTDPDAGWQPRTELLNALFRMAQLLTVTGSFSTIRNWLLRTKPSLREDENFPLASAALAALAITQPRGSSEVRQFWVQLWTDGPPSWWARAFIGLRLQSASAAIDQVPVVLDRADKSGQSAGPLLEGLWQQEDASHALAAWLACDSLAARNAKQVLVERLPPSERLKLQNSVMTPSESTSSASAHKIQPIFSRARTPETYIRDRL